MRPELVILHYTGMPSGQSAEDWLCDLRSEVSSHYIVHEDGRIVQMVREADRAWHAGKSSWRGVSDINSQSIGIEIVNPGHGLGYPAFPRRQIRAVVTLCDDIVARQGMNPSMVLGHSDVAPGRKVDPGEKFPWHVLARAGLGDHVPASLAGRGAELKAGDEGQGVADLQSLLARYGYGIDITGVFDPPTVAVVEAFQRHFRRRRVDGIADASTVRTLRRLVEQLES